MCSCGVKYDVQRSLSCKKGDFVTLRHNHLRNITANLIDQVCHDVRVEPPFQVLTGDAFDSRSTNVRDEATIIQKTSKYVRLTLVFMCNRTLLEKFNFCFSRVFC